MKTRLIESIDFTREEYNEKTKGDNGFFSFDEFIDNVLTIVKDLNGNLEDAIFIAEDAFDKI